MKLKHLLENNKKNFNYTANDLTSLKRLNVPKEVDGNFYCGSNRLTSLEGAPEKVGGDFYCYKNKLTSLKGSPNEVGGDFLCYENKLTSLEGAPAKVGYRFACGDNSLTSLKGAPKGVRGDFSCGDNQITSLEGIHKQINRIEGKFWAANNPIESHVLGLLLIDGITEIYLDNEEVAKILNEHLDEPNKRQRVAHAQRELIEADLDEFAEK